jgi:hypothetical protein
MLAVEGRGDGIDRHDFKFQFLVLLGDGEWGDGWIYRRFSFPVDFFDFAEVSGFKMDGWMDDG